MPRPTYRPDSGNIGDADPEDAGSDADAWLWYRAADRADQRRRLSRKSGSLMLALSRMERSGRVKGEWRATENNRRAIMP
jgi:hypothetical protein